MPLWRAHGHEPLAPGGGLRPSADVRLTSRLERASGGDSRVSYSPIKTKMLHGNREQIEVDRDADPEPSSLLANAPMEADSCAPCRKLGLTWSTAWLRLPDATQRYRRARDALDNNRQVLPARAPPTRARMRLHICARRPRAARIPNSVQHRATLT